MVKGTVAVSAVLYPNNKQYTTIDIMQDTRRMFGIIHYVSLQSASRSQNEFFSLLCNNISWDPMGHHEKLPWILPIVSAMNILSFRQVVLTPATHVMSHCFLQQTYINKQLLQLGLNLEIWLQFLVTILFYIIL